MTIPHEDFESLKKFLAENIPELEALFIIDSNGNVTDKKMSLEFEKGHSISWLLFFAGVVFTRFPMSGFNKQLGGLKMTVNVFEEKTVIVKMLKSNHILVVVVPWKTSSVFNAMNIMYDEKYSSK